MSFYSTNIPKTNTVWYYSIAYSSVNQTVFFSGYLTFSCFADNTTFSTSNGSVQVAGSASIYKCLEILEFFLRTAEDSWCYPKPCAIGRTYQPAVGNTVFYAISAFVYAPTYLGAVDSHGRLNISLLLEKAEVYCSKVRLHLNIGIRSRSYFNTYFMIA